VVKRGGATRKKFKRGGSTAALTSGSQVVHLPGRGGGGNKSNGVGGGQKVSAMTYSGNPQWEKVTNILHTEKKRSATGIPTRKDRHWFKECCSTGGRERRGGAKSRLLEGGRALGKGKSVVRNPEGSTLRH